MIPSPQLLEFLRGWEGPAHFKPREDPCVPGTWDIGYGHVCVKDRAEIDADDAESLLQADVDRIGDSVDDLVTFPLRQHQYDALVSFAFNLGVLRLESSTLLRLVNGGDLQAAAPPFDRWIHAGGNVVQGLIRRRAAEKRMFTAADYSMRP